jgi:hypothetical protein
MNNKEREDLLIKLHNMINDRLAEINMSHYSWDLAELNDPVINAILDLRKNILSTNKYNK